MNSDFGSGNLIRIFSDFLRRTFHVLYFCFNSDNTRLEVARHRSVGQCKVSGSNTRHHSQWVPTTFMLWLRHNSCENPSLVQNSTMSETDPQHAPTLAP